MQTHLKETWVPTLSTSIRHCLVDITKGWFNLEETNWEVYQRSKLKKFLELTKFAMQVNIIFMSNLLQFTTQFVIYLFVRIL